MWLGVVVGQHCGSDDFDFDHFSWSEGPNLSAQARAKPGERLKRFVHRRTVCFHRRNSAVAVL